MRRYRRRGREHEHRAVAAELVGRKAAALRARPPQFDELLEGDPVEGRRRVELARSGRDLAGNRGGVIAIQSADGTYETVDLGKGRAGTQDVRRLVVERDEPRWTPAAKS